MVTNQQIMQAVARFRLGSRMLLVLYSREDPRYHVGITKGVFTGKMDTETGEESFTLKGSVTIAPVMNPDGAVLHVEIQSAGTAEPDRIDIPITEHTVLV